MADGSSKPKSKSVTLEMVKELIDAKHNSYSEMVKTLMDSFNARLDSLSRELRDIKRSVEFSQAEVDDLKVKIISFDVISKKVDNMKKGFEELADKVDYLENQSRRNNIRICGINEDRRENWDSTEKKVKGMLEDHLNIDPDDIEIERAHRTGRSKDGKPRQIIAKLLRYKDKEKILKNTKNLKGTGIFINEDFSSRVMKRRRDQQDALINARKQGKLAYFNVDRLIVKDRMSSLQQSPFGSLGASGFYSNDG